MVDIENKIEELLLKLKPHPFDRFVWVGKNFSKKDLCDYLKETIVELKEDNGNNIQNR